MANNLKSKNVQYKIIYIYYTRHNNLRQKAIKVWSLDNFLHTGTVLSVCHYYIFLADLLFRCNILFFYSIKSVSTFLGLSKIDPALKQIKQVGYVV